MQPWQLCHRSGQFRQFTRFHAGLAVFTGDIHLQAHLQVGQLRRALCAEALGDFQPVHTVHPVEMLGDGACLVGLDRPDEVPAKAEIRQRLNFGQPFLQVILAEITQPQRSRGAHLVRQAGFADGEQTYRPRRALAFFRAESYSFEEPGNPLSELFVLHGEMVADSAAARRVENNRLPRHEV